MVDPQAKAMEDELGQIAGLAVYAETLIQEFARGRTNPVDRLNAARQAGMQSAQNDGRAEHGAALSGELARVGRAA